MTSPIFIDTNIPVYAVGRPHQLKSPSDEIMRLAARQDESFVTDAEVLQEILHRYLALRNWMAGREVFRWFTTLMEGRIEEVRAEDVRTAARWVDDLPGLDARDLLHLAIMQRLGVTRIVTADAAFDAVNGIERLNPARFAEWRDSI